MSKMKFLEPLEPEKFEIWNLRDPPPPLGVFDTFPYGILFKYPKSKPQCSGFIYIHEFKQIDLFSHICAVTKDLSDILQT